MAAQELLTLLASCSDLLANECAEHGIDLEIANDAAARYLARAACDGPECEDTDLLCAVAQSPAPTPFDGTVFACVNDALDGGEVVVWSDDHGRDGRFIINPNL